MKTTRECLTAVSSLCLAGVMALVSQAQVTIAETTDRGLTQWQIATPAATYGFEKSGAGLARLIDRDGHDWLSFDPEPGSGSAGEFRGFPNAVHQQAGNYFHPKNKATDEARVAIEHQTPQHISISAVASNGLWSCRYDFFATHCLFTMTQMPADKKYWVLYEGTPGGQFDATDWWLTSGLKTRQPLTQTHEGDIPAPEWIVFGDEQSQRVIFLLHFEDDDHPDRYYPMRSQMTVFGFGRAGTNKYLDRVPQTFALGFLETVDPDVITRQLGKLLTSGGKVALSGAEK